MLHNKWSYTHHTDDECISVERYTLIVLIHSGRITGMVWGVQISPENIYALAATAVLLSVLNKVFDCLGSDEINEDVPPISSAKVAGSTEAHNRLPWPTGYQLDHWVLENAASYMATESPDCSDGENWWRKTKLTICLIYRIYLLTTEENH